MRVCCTKEPTVNKKDMSNDEIMSDMLEMLVQLGRPNGLNYISENVVFNVFRNPVDHILRLAFTTGTMPPMTLCSMSSQSDCRCRDK